MHACVSTHARARLRGVCSRACLCACVDQGAPPASAHSLTHALIVPRRVAIVCLVENPTYPPRLSPVSESDLFAAAACGQRARSDGGAHARPHSHAPMRAVAHFAHSVRPAPPEPFVLRLFPHSRTRARHYCHPCASLSAYAPQSPRTRATAQTRAGSSHCRLELRQCASHWHECGEGRCAP